ncbi:MFS transporter, partial [Desulfofundulus sp.]|uniref:MFS transporter n=1 Tax=Desulfofundulus sp. TaxID=2282750 RepID=UPI003C74A4E4
MVPAVGELLGKGAAATQIGYYGGIIMSIYLIGAAVGGIIFGIVSDYLGRVRTLIFTILVYSLMTGLSGFAHSWEQLALFRFLTGLGVGGEWAAGAALLAETWPDELRPYAASFMQMAWPVGFFFAALINYIIGPMGWRAVFWVGAVPALLTFFVRMSVKEPEKWLVAHRRRLEVRRNKSAAGQVEREYSTFTLYQLFTRQYIKSTIIGFLIAFVALFGLYGSTNWIPATVNMLAKEAGLGVAAIKARVLYATLLQNAGAIVGALVFGPIAYKWGRRPAFLIFFLGNLLIAPPIYHIAKDYALFIMLVPLLGFFANGVFSGLPIYLPELFPTRIRATGQGTCYNGARIISALSPFMTGLLISWFHGNFAYASAAVCSIYLVGLITLAFARETKDQPLPE